MKLNLIWTLGGPRKGPECEKFFLGRSQNNSATRSGSKFLRSILRANQVWNFLLHFEIFKCGSCSAPLTRRYTSQIIIEFCILYGN